MDVLRDLRITKSQQFVEQHLVKSVILADKSRSLNTDEFQE